VFPERPTVAGTDLRLGFYAVVDEEKHGPVTWSPYSTPSMALILALYESVRIKSLDLQFQVRGGQGAMLYAAVTYRGARLSNEGWYAAPYLKMVGGSDQGTVSDSWSLPTDHPFNPEVRSGVKGNGPPELHLAYVGDATNEALVFGTVVVTVAGQIPLNAININPAKPAKASATVKAVWKSLPYDVHEGSCGFVVEDSEESEDEEDDNGPVSPGPSSKAPAARGGVSPLARPSKAA